MTALLLPLTHSSPVLTITVLGPFTATLRDGSELKLPKKAQALLCFLIANRGRYISREDAAALLWSNTDAVQSRQSLRQCLSVLCKALPPDAAAGVIREKERLLLAEGQSMLCDLETFERACKSNDANGLACADANYRSELLQGLRIKNEPFDDWLAVERQRLAGARLTVIERLVRLRAQTNDLSVAIELARRLVALDRYREQSYRLLMELLAASGQRGLALVEHARLEQALRDDLGLSPDTVTRALAERIKRGHVNVPAAGGPSIAASNEPTADARRASLSGSSKTPLSLPQVVVLKFANLMGTSRHDALAYAITQDVTVALARDRFLDVAADESAGARCGSDLPIREGQWVYGVNGSLRSDGRRVRVVVQLSSRSSGRCLWSSQFEHDASPSLVAQDLLSGKIAARLSHAIRSSEIERTRRLPEEELSYRQICLRAGALSRSGQPGNRAALRLLRRVLAEDPDFGMAHAVAARCFHVQRMMGWLSPDDRSLKEGIQHADAAVELSGDDPEALWMAGLAIMNIDGNLTRGRNLIDRSIAVDPHSPNAWIAGSFLHCHLGDGGSALGHFQRADRLNPFDGSHHVQQNAAATANFVAGNYAAAHTASEATLAMRPGYAAALRIKVATASLLGLADEADRAARELLALEPDASIARMREYWKALAPNAPEAFDAKLDGWRRAGMPE